MSAPLLELDAVVKRYALPREHLFGKPPEVTALAGVSLQVTAGKSLGIVGESGSGKSTLARIAMALEEPTSGARALRGTRLRRALARGDAQAAPRFPDGVPGPLRLARSAPQGGVDRRRAARRGGRAARGASPTALASVGLRPADMAKYPHEFSGGQRQRIAIARALITRPRLIVADEPVSALDVSVQAQVLNLLEDLQRDFGVTFLLISHDLAVVDHVCDAVAVMYRGRVVEEGPPAALFHGAAHPYSRALIAAVPKPVPGRRRRRLSPRAVAFTPREAGPAGCPYAERCELTRERCFVEPPPLRQVAEGRRAACHFAEEVMRLPQPG